jgi:3-oxoadipate enol-lactonase
MIGRTLLQQARPISFGYKVATWLSGLLDSKRALNRLKKNNLLMQLGGAVGSLSNMPDQGLAVQKLTAKYLGLKSPDISWFTQRNSIAEIASSLGIFNMSISKIANDVCLMMQTEIAEVFEGKESGKGGSSTMPHKRNPVSSAAILANSYRIPPLVSTMISSLKQSHERDPGAWHAEWETMESIVQLTGGSLENCLQLLKNLEVDANKMLENLELTKGLIYAENVSLFLAQSMGKTEAHTFTENACKKAVQNNTTLENILVNENIGLNKEMLAELFKPLNSLGNCESFTQNMIGKAQRKMKFVEIDQQNIHYKIEGKSDLPFLILSNSLGSEMKMWDEVMPYLLSNFQILRYDTRGHGESKFIKTNETLSIARLAKDVIELMDKLNIKSAVFCGLSMGGLIGQHLGIHYADRIEKVVLCNTGAKIGDDERWNSRIKTISENGMQAIVEDTMVRWFRESYIKANPGKIEEFRQMFLRSQVDGYSACCEAIRDADFRTANSKNTIPTLVIAGNEDPVTTLENGKFIAETVQNGQVLELNAKHLSAAEQALEFAFGILKFTQND